MAILLYHASTSGNIATPSSKIDGTPYAARRYQHDGHIIVIDGPPHVIAHDAREICKIPGYRMATPAEANAYYAAQRGETVLQEDTSSNSITTDDTASGDDSMPTSQTLTTDNAPSGNVRGRRKGQS